MFSRLLHGSIKKKLAILFLWRRSPPSSSSSLRAWAITERAVASAEQELQAFSRHLAQTQTQTTQAAKTLLEGLALLPEVRQADSEECNRLFASLLKINPAYAAIHLVDREWRACRLRQRPQAGKLRPHEALSGRRSPPGLSPPENTCSA
jgi:two-component system, sensor histidine kinase